MNLSTLFASNPGLVLGLIVLGLIIGLIIKGKPLVLMAFLAMFGYFGFIGAKFVETTNMKQEIIQQGGFEKALRVRVNAYQYKTIHELEKYDL